MMVRGQERDGVMVVALDGSLDSGTVVDTQMALDRLLPTGGPVLLDLSGTTYLSSAGLRLLLLLYRHLRRHGGRLALAAVPEDVRLVLEATGFVDSMLVTETVDDALAALAGGRRRTR
jgi:anti-sigma B factor antagonist